MFRKPIYSVLFFVIILLQTPILVSSDQYESEMNKGIEYVRLKIYPKAVDTFKLILSSNPNDIDALYQLAIVYKLQDKLELAIDTSEKILSNTRKRKDKKGELIYGFTHLLLSEIYCNQSKLDVAEKHAKAAIQRYPSVANTHYRLGYIYTHQARFDEANVTFQKTLELNPDFAEVHQWLGLIALMQHKPQDAITHYETAIKQKPYIQSAYYNLAKAYRLIGDMESAAFQLKRFQEIKTYYDKTYAIEGFLSEDPSNVAPPHAISKDPY